MPTSSRRGSTRTRPPRSLCRDASIPKKQLGQHFLADENILGVIGRLAELAPDDVVLEIGPGLGVLTRYLADRVAPRSRRRARPLARAAPRGAARRRANVELHFGRRARARPRRARARADEARREPPVQRRDARSSPRASTGLPGRRALVRDGAAGGRRSLLRRAVDEGVRRRLGADPARRRAGRASIRSSRPSSGRRRTSTRRSSLSAASPLPERVRPDQARRRGGVRPPPQDAAELARARRPRRPRRAQPPRSRRSGAAPRPGPRRSRPPSSSR